MRVVVLPCKVCEKGGRDKKIEENETIFIQLYRTKGWKELSSDRHRCGSDGSGSRSVVERHGFFVEERCWLRFGLGRARFLALGIFEGDLFAE